MKKSKMKQYLLGFCFFCLLFLSGKQAKAEEFQFYYQFLNEDQRELYNRIIDAAQTYETEVEVNSLSEAQTEQAYLAVYYDHPELFWLTSGYQYWTDSEESVTGIEMEYNSTWEEKEEQSRQIEAAIQEVFYEIDYGQDTYGKIKSAYEYLINRIDYVADSPYNQDIRSVFLNWQSVCTGYTKAMQVLLERMGIFCTCVRGTANGGHHAWNLVQIDGEYYYVDATWGDPVYLGEEDISSDIDYTYLCCTEEVLFRTHTPEDMAILPECSSELYNYYALNGMYLYSGDRDSIYNYVVGIIQQGGREAVMSFPSEESYFLAKAELLDYGLLDELMNQYLQIWGEDQISFTYETRDQEFVIRIYW